MDGELGDEVFFVLSFCVSGRKGPDGTME